MDTELTIGLDAPRDGVGVVHVAGALVADTAHSLVDAVDVELGPIGGDELLAVDIDLRQVHRCDRDGMRVILAVVRRAARRGVPARVQLSPCVRAALVRERNRIACRRAVLA